MHYVVIGLQAVNYGYRVWDAGKRLYKAYYRCNEMATHLQNGENTKAAVCGADAICNIVMAGAEGVSLHGEVRAQYKASTIDLKDTKSIQTGSKEVAAWYKQAAQASICGAGAAIVSTAAVMYCDRLSLSEAIRANDIVRRLTQATSLQMTASAWGLRVKMIENRVSKQIVDVANEVKTGIEANNKIPPPIKEKAQELNKTAETCSNHLDQMCSCEKNPVVCSLECQSLNKQGEELQINSTSLRTYCDPDNPVWDTYTPEDKQAVISELQGFVQEKLTKLEALVNIMRGFSNDLTTGEIVKGSAQLINNTTYLV